MSKIKLNATTMDLISVVKLDDLKMLERTNPESLTIRDHDGNCIFKVMTGKESAVTKNALMFAHRDINGYAVITLNFTIPNAAADHEALYSQLYDSIGAAKNKLDDIEGQIIAAIAEERVNKAAFIAELTGENENETDSVTANTPAEQ